jgi:cytochrome c biogenesis protein CcdA
MNNFPKKNWIGSIGFKVLVITLSLLMLFVTAFPSSANPESREEGISQCVYFFYTEGCHSCDIANAYLSNVEQNFSLTIHRFEVHNATNYNLMVKYYSFHNISSYAVPVLFIGNEVLIQPSAIEAHLVPLLQNNTGWVCPSYNSTVPPYEEPKSPPFSIIIGLAFADSMNPCAISVLLLLIVTITITSASLWKTGLSYILGNFFAYLGVGFGLFSLLQQFHLPSYTTKVVAVVAILMAFVTLYQKLPSQTKPLIKKLISGITSPYFAFFIGAVISIIELPCSGGPYFLALTLMSQYNLSQFEILGYLIIYNLIFVLPLVVVLLLYLYTQSPKIPKQYVRWISAIMMLLMGIFLLLT